MLGTFDDRAVAAACEGARITRVTVAAAPDEGELAVPEAMRRTARVTSRGKIAHRDVDTLLEQRVVERRTSLSAISRLLLDLDVSSELSL